MCKCTDCNSWQFLGCETSLEDPTECPNFDRSCRTCTDFWCCAEEDDDVRPECLAHDYSMYTYDERLDDEEIVKRNKELRNKLKIKKGAK